MSKQHTGLYTEAEIADLESRYSAQKVAAMVEEARLVHEADQDLIGDGDVEGYESKTVEELTELLEDRGLPKSGKKAELVERLQEDDAK
jgi:hypothetical protein